VEHVVRAIGPLTLVVDARIPDRGGGRGAKGAALETSIGGE
jgi:hypothetical protein